MDSGALTSPIPTPRLVYLADEPGCDLRLVIHGVGAGGVVPLTLEQAVNLMERLVIAVARRSREVAS